MAVFLLLQLSFSGDAAPATVDKSINLSTGATAEASSQRAKYPAGLAVDSTVMDSSRWLSSEDDDSPWLEIRLKDAEKVEVVDIYSGYSESSAIRDFNLEVWDGRRWHKKKNWQVRGNTQIIHRISLKTTVLKLKLIPVGKRSQPARIQEIAMYRDANTPFGTGLKQPARAIPTDAHLVALNQIGFDLNFPKRFTAPLTEDGVKFNVRSAKGAKVLYSGIIKNHIGDFSAFHPQGLNRQFVITIRGGKLKDGMSDPFEIRKNFLKANFWQSAVDFLNDSRSVVGTHPSAYGGCAWRDGTYYDAIVPALSMFYLSNPAAFEAMPKQIDWEADKKRLLSPDFQFDKKNPCAEGVMDAVRHYYTKLDPPNPNAPDIVKLIHWGAGYYCFNPSTRDSSGDPLGRRIHSQTIEQVSYVLLAWPELKKWLPQSFYRECHDLCFENWEEMGALEVPEYWKMDYYLESIENRKGKPLHPYKGRHAPGHSIVPNLTMYEVAKRENRSDSQRYLDAAIQQAAWIIKNIDWNDPRTTKGHRMSEHRTITNLVYLLQNYPKVAPKGLREKIEDWARVAVNRSNNMWDFRRYDLDANWTIPKLNDVGNIVGAPSILLAASWVVKDKALKSRLNELAVAHVDSVFGRNPRFAAAPHAPDNGFKGIERGWPKGYKKNVCARLELCRGSISSAPGTEMYPFNPKGGFRHSEGWVNYGASWCMTLAYFEYDDQKKSARSRWIKPPISRSEK